MALALSRGAVKVSSGFRHGLCKASNGNAVTQVAFITSKKMRENRPPRPPPFDYKNKRYTFWQVFFDPMEKRFDDNTKIIVVDGLPGVGKTKFCRQLAEELEMYYFTGTEFDDIYIDKHGFDYRLLNPKLPEEVQFHDYTTFLRNPNFKRNIVIEANSYGLCYVNYVDALAHLFSTGQGVIMERSPWSHVVFPKAMQTCGYMNRNCLDFYKSCNEVSLHRLLKPHLCIYLDAPVDRIKENITKRARPIEKDSTALTPQFLSELERNYKEIVLPEVSKHAHLLVYDWQDGGIMDDVIDDIEGLECDPDKMVDMHSPKLADWRFTSPDEVRACRTEYTNHRGRLAIGCIATRWDCPEMLSSGQANATLAGVLDDLYEADYGKKYARGFDPTRDKNVIWKRCDHSDDYVSKRDRTQD